MNAPAKLTRLEIFEHARKEVIDETMEFFRQLVQDCLNGAETLEARMEITAIANLAERYARGDCFDAVGIQLGRMLDIKAYQMAMKKMRVATEHAVLYKRLRHIVTIKFKAAETEEQFETLERILDELKEIDTADTAKFSAAIKIIITRLEQL